MSKPIDTSTIPRHLRRLAYSNAIEGARLCVDGHPLAGELRGALSELYLELALCAEAVAR